MHRCAPYALTEVNKNQHLHLLTVVDFWQLASRFIANTCTAKEKLTEDATALSEGNFDILAFWRV